MIKLIDVFDQKFRFINTGIPLLEVGEYEVKAYYIFDDRNFTKTLFLDTTTGYYKSTSTTLVGSIFGGFGKLLQEQFDKGETVLVEIVSKRATHKGKFGLAFRSV